MFELTGSPQPNKSTLFSSIFGSPRSTSNPKPINTTPNYTPVNSPSLHFNSVDFVCNKISSMTTIIQHLQLQLLQQQQAIDNMHERLRNLHGPHVPTISITHEHNLQNHQHSEIPKDALSETEDEVNQRYERISEVLMSLIDQAQTALEPGLERSRISTMFSPSSSPSPGPSRPLSRKCSCLLNSNSRQMEIPLAMSSPVFTSRYRDQSTQTDLPYTIDRRYSECQSYSVSSCDSIFSEEDEEENLFRDKCETWVDRRKTHYETYSSEAEYSEEEVLELPPPRKRFLRNKRFDRDIFRLFTNMLSWESALCELPEVLGRLFFDMAALCGVLLKFVFGLLRVSRYSSSSPAATYHSELNKYLAFRKRKYHSRLRKSQRHTDETNTSLDVFTNIKEFMFI
ncbi:hypothetical protein K7432_005569 [Basidiobolus ranarum]|uniref:Uncharacterized protein n=1 Tax=Basidiobolus ranarum TaxID=34480 RepID=A0ABR2W3F4_9FUNG